MCATHLTKLTFFKASRLRAGQLILAILYLVRITVTQGAELCVACLLASRHRLKGLTSLFRSSFNVCHDTSRQATHTLGGADPYQINAGWDQLSGPQATGCNDCMQAENVPARCASPGSPQQNTWGGRPGWTILSRHALQAHVPTLNRTSLRSAIQTSVKHAINNS